MKKIIAATDFSAAAANAAAYAADMAGAIGASLTLFHVYQIPLSLSEVPAAFTADAEMKTGAETAAERLKETLISRTGGTVPVDVLVTEGGFFTNLKAVCENMKPYAVVLGSQGTTAAERLLLGSHAGNAARNLDWPVITVPPGAAYTSIKKIGFASDFGDVTATTPVDEIKMLVSSFNAELHILNTGRQHTFSPGAVFESGMLQELLAGLKPVYHIITAADTDEGIIEFAEKNEIDLLVVLPRRRNFIDRLLHRSHTKQLVLHSHVPVLALHKH